MVKSRWMLRLSGVVLLAGGLLAAGCANNFEMNYVPEETGTFYLPTQQVQVVAYTPEKLASLKSQGFRVIGVSNILGQQISAQDDMRQVADAGKKLGAEVALYESKFHDQAAGVKQVTTYQPGQTVTYEGRDGRKPYYGTATTQPTYGTAYVPVTIDRYERKVTFLRKSP